MYRSRPNIPTARPRAAGNSIMEYVLPGLLILAASLGALNMLGINLNTYFDQFKQSMTTQVAATQTQLQQQQVQKAGFRPSASPSMSSHMPSLPHTVGLRAVGETIQTVGVNGGTEMLASSLYSYIQQLVASGDLSPDQADILSRLANAGHHLAEAEKALANAQKSGQSSVTYGGKTYAVSDFAQQFGFNNTVGIDAAKSMDSSQAMAQLAPFMQLYEQAQASGSLKDPNINAQVTYLSQQIAALSDLAKWNPASTTSNQNLNAGYVTAMEQVGIANAPPSISEATHTDSNGICDASTGGLCQQ